MFGVFILFQDYSIADMSSYTKNPIQRFEDQTLNRGMMMSPLSNLSMKVHVDEQLILSPEINVVSLRGLLTYKMPKKHVCKIKKCSIFDPIALRMAKTLWSFSRSECNRVKVPKNRQEN